MPELSYGHFLGCHDVVAVVEGDTHASRNVDIQSVLVLLFLLAVGLLNDGRYRVLIVDTYIIRCAAKVVAVHQSQSL